MMTVQELIEELEMYVKDVGPEARQELVAVLLYDRESGEQVQADIRPIQPRFGYGRCLLEASR
jgi:hypothetical protein